MSFALLLTVVSTSPAHAQVVNRQPANLVDPSKTSVTHYKIDGWQTEQGLPLNTLQTIYQARAGYLWVGMAAGLARFDGIRFAIFECSPVPELVARPYSALWKISNAIFGSPPAAARRFIEKYSPNARSITHWWKVVACGHWLRLAMTSSGLRVRMDCCAGRRRKMSPGFVRRQSGFQPTAYALSFFTRKERSGSAQLAAAWSHLRRGNIRS